MKRIFSQSSIFERENNCLVWKYLSDQVSDWKRIEESEKAKLFLALWNRIRLFFRSSFRGIDHAIENSFVVVVFVSKNGSFFVLYCLLSDSTNPLVRKYFHPAKGIIKLDCRLRMVFENFYGLSNQYKSGQP